MDHDKITGDENTPKHIRVTNHLFDHFELQNSFEDLFKPHVSQALPDTSHNQLVKCQ